MNDFQERTRLLVGESGQAKLESKTVFLAGLGGVGGYIAEALVRAGIQSLTLHDADTISRSNINRQLIALHSTLGRKKTAVMKERLLDINPNCQIKTQESFITKEVIAEVLKNDHDIIIDAIDVSNCKLAFLTHARRKNAKLYSSLGAGNRIDPTKIRTGDLFSSKHCRLAKKLRKYLKHAGIYDGICAVWSEEIGYAPKMEMDEQVRPINGSISTIPGLFGLTLAGLVIRDILAEKQIKA